jgi:hypothetical protein
LERDITQNLPDVFQLGDGHTVNASVFKQTVKNFLLFRLFYVQLVIEQRGGDAQDDFSRVL